MNRYQFSEKPVRKVESSHPWMCPQCRGENSKGCSMCNGHGKETAWACRSNKHHFWDFDNIEDDPRTKPCPECGATSE